MLVVTGGDGTGWEPVGDPVIRRDGDTVILSGTIDHFSRLAAIPEQVFIETRLVETSTDGTNTFGVGFTWSNGARLEAPAARSASFRTGGAGASQLPATFEEGMLSVQCPSGAASLFGDASLNLLLDAVDGTTGETGLVSTPRLTTADQMQATLDIGLELACRPTIAEDGSVRMEIRVDHPGGEEIVPNQDFRGGLSAMLLVLARGFPGLYAGLIRDVNSNGMIDPEDLMYPPFPATADGDTTSVVLPLFGYGDYFPYLIDGQPPQIETQITVADGGTILLGGLTREQTSVPFLGGVPYLARVFSEESSQSDEVELLIFLTPQIVESDR
jgi:Flp pilus assembly secretin CpaC